MLGREEAHAGGALKQKRGPVSEEKRGSSSYTGLVPAECRFEAMLVEVKFVAERWQT